MDERKARAGFIAALVCLAAVGVLFYASFERLRANTTWIEHTQQVLNRLERLLSLTTDAEAAERGYVITGDRAYEEAYRAAATAIGQVEAELHGLVADNLPQQQRLDDLTNTIAERLARLRTVMDVQTAEGFSAAQKLIQAGVGKHIHQRLREQIGRIADVERTLLAERQHRLERYTAVTLAMGAGSTSLALACVAWAALVSRRDLIERKRVEGQRAHDLEDLRLARDEANRANHTKGRFLATASHDLRQPLQTLSMLNGTLRRLATDTDAAAAVAQQEQAIGSMSALLNALLNISKLESGAIKPQIADFELSELAQELRVELLEPAARKGLRLQIAACHESVLTDRVLLGQILRNLLGNAIRYTATGSVRLECEREGDRLRIDLMDTGVGIAEDELQNIFEEFYQAGVTGSTKREGYGLGLNIVHRVARLLNHELRVRSQLGKGSVFSVLVPLGAATASQSQPREPGRTAAAPALEPHVLLVDDDTAVLNATRMLLKVGGYRVTVGGSVGEALVQARVNPDLELLITDLHLGDGQLGTEVIQSVRNALGRSLKAVLLTGDTSSLAKEVAEDSDLRISNKPINADELLELVSSLTRREV